MDRKLSKSVRLEASEMEWILRQAHQRFESMGNKDSKWTQEEIDDSIELVKQTMRDLVEALAAFECEVKIKCFKDIDPDHVASGGNCPANCKGC